VLVLNKNYEPLTVCHAQRAVVLVVLGKAEIVERYDGIVRSVSRAVPLPSVVRLSMYIRAPRQPVALTRRNVLKRDGYRCQYCASRRGPMTTDTSFAILGGKNSGRTWCVHRCNNRKGRTPGRRFRCPGRRPPRSNDLLLGDSHKRWNRPVPTETS
jgi:5-methylcytosine-specific restriction endonuclease McrA